MFLALLMYEDPIRSGKEGQLQLQQAQGLVVQGLSVQRSNTDSSPGA
jgi:hypothetical protein